MAVKFKDYYQTLGVARTASPDEIKQAFRKLARIHHPDVAKNKSSAEEKFKEINEANEVLSDPEKRKRYDELGADWETGGSRPPPNHRGRAAQSAAGASEPDVEFGGTGFSDFFESYFSGRPGGFGAGRSRASRSRQDDDANYSYPGEDIEADLLVTLEEALRGAVRKVTLRRSSGLGDADRTNTYQVRIPQGVHEGQRIRLAGQGEPGGGGGPAGDLYLRVRLASHPDFSVQGSDLYCDYDLAPWEAVLGIQAKIPTLGGMISVKVPPGTLAGSQLRLRGQGLAKQDGTRGDLYATARIQIPSTTSEEERKLWEQLAKVSTFNPRNSL